MSFLSNNYMQKPPSQSIPVELKYNGPDAQDVVVNKTTVSLVPVSGDIFYGTSELSSSPYSKVLKFRIRSNNWIDLKSLRINAKASIQQTGEFTLSNMAMPDDGLYSFINSARVFLNSQLVEDISEYHRLIPLLAYSSMKREYYNGVGSFEGWHRFSDKQFYPEMSINGSTIVPASDSIDDIKSAFKAVTDRYSPLEQNPRYGLAKMLNEGMDISLHPWTGVTTMEKFLPPNVTLELEFQFNEPKDCLTNRSDSRTAEGPRSIKWEGVRMVYDQVELHPAYTARFEQELKKGIPMVFDTYSLNRSYLPSTNTQHNVLISRGVSRLRTLLMVQNDTAVNSAGDPKKYKSAQFNWNNVVNVRALANSEYFPSSYGMEGRVPEIFRQLQIAFDKNEDADASGVLNLLNYTGRTEGFPVGANAPSAPQQAFIVGINFQKMPGVRTSGLDLSSLGGNIQVELTQSDVADEDQTLYSYLHYDKGIMLTDQGLAVSE